MRAKWATVVALAVIGVTAAALSGCSVMIGPTSGDGDMADGSFSYSGTITKIDISHMPATINLTPDKRNAVTYSIDSNLKDSLDLSFVNGVLTITTKNNAVIASTHGITFNVGADALQEIAVSGAATINGSGTFTANSFTMTIDGAGTANLALAAKTASVTVSGAASLTLSGTADQATITLTGASTVKARNLSVQKASISVSGAGSVQITATQTLAASVAGVGSVTYWGNPELTKSTAGLSSVKPGS